MPCHFGLNADLVALDRFGRKLPLRLSLCICFAATSFCLGKRLNSFQTDAQLLSASVLDPQSTREVPRVMESSGWHLLFNCAEV